MDSVKVKVGNLELDVAGKVTLDKEYTVVNVPDADEYKGFPPSWEFVKSHMLTWRPYFKGKIMEVGEDRIPILGDFILNLTEEMHDFLLAIYDTFKAGRPSIETNISTVITEQLNEVERKLGRSLTSDERTEMYVRYGVEAAILRDIGVIN
ncbi:hypothetical protein [Sulfuracidifex tepidarius]|uniref:Uncharacterized protein n=1 Tax=Sulfuracidifex tepidarius TaxID=1294262 RepID=A0A510DZU0_9CREN|nr:hypothetical protein [Sulfuracidifex tepidarius]BBG22971.1 hypothetical protein IC006_0255 [Sulfuracidifex tepidarius]BBG25732.1 hypothetical protein IC007_0237 [Sulfuracidifex tepidarius]